MVQRRALLLYEELHRGQNDVCIDLNGSDEYLSNNTLASHGFGNAWTITFWAKPFTNVSASALFYFNSSVEESKIIITINPLAEGLTSQMQVQTWGSDSVAIKHYGWNRPSDDGGFFEENQWVHGALTWNGTDLKAYWFGSLANLASTFVDDSGTMADNQRQTFYGTSIDTWTNWKGRIGHLAIWNEVLDTSELAEISNGTFLINLKKNQGDYTSSTRLKHYWRPGAVINDIGEDSAGALDIMQAAANITSGDDIVTDSPT